MSFTNTLLLSYITFSFSPVTTLYTIHYTLFLPVLYISCAEFINKTLEMDKVVQIKRQIFAV